MHGRLLLQGQAGDVGPNELGQQGRQQPPVISHLPHTSKHPQALRARAEPADMRPFSQTPCARQEESCVWVPPRSHQS